MPENQAEMRQRAREQARQFLAAQPLFLDTETTGVRSTAEVIEICLVDHQGQVCFNSLVHPRLPIPAESTQIHGISNAMVALAPTWSQLWPQVQSLLTSRPIGIYNADFDMRLIRQTHIQQGLPWDANPITSFCIMLLYAQFYGEWDEQRNSYRWQSLEKARQRFNLPLPNSHCAKDDALLARAVLEQIAYSEG